MRVALAVFLLALPCLGAPVLRADGTVSTEPRPGSVAVPAVAGRSLEQARGALERAGLLLGRVYEMDWRRVERTWGARVEVGLVFSQRPQPGLYYDRGGPVDVMVAAEADGRLPDALPAARAAGAPPPAAHPSVPPPPPPPELVSAGAGTGGGSSSAPAVPLAVGTTAEPPALPAAPPVGPGHLDREVRGNPDAPRVVRELDPARVPDLRGLPLADAEQWVRDLSLTLYVERVGGHPIGRVLRQIPEAGSPRPAGEVVKVLVTAGGDYEEHVPGAPAALVEHVEVPEVLDRTSAQAHRILNDLGLRVLERVAARGLAGRVVDQLPSLGDRLLKGEYVLIWIGPPDPATPAPGRAAAPAAAPAVAPSAVVGAAPLPIAPTEGTVLPRQASIPLGFSWRAAKGADAYLLEVEEETADGGWMGILRKAVRTTAAAVDVERVSTQPARRLRWRVRALEAGREGPTSAWIVMR